MTSVFKYTKYRPEFFDNFFLKLSRFGEFNDPFEMVMGNYLYTVKQQEYDQVMSLSPILSDPASYIDAYWDAQCGARASLGIICFTTQKDNLLMWAHYANDHTGICIELDAEANFFNGQYANMPVFPFDEGLSEDRYKNVGVLKPVKYSSQRPLYLESKELEYNTDAWFVKSPEWSYEEELRLLLPVDHAEDPEDSEHLFYRLDPQAIRSVILGCQMPLEIKQEVYSKCKSIGIQVKEAFVHSHLFKLDIVNYDDKNNKSYLNEYNLNRVTKFNSRT